jgi:hypothetical protein
MSESAHHREALIETARLELGRAHKAALQMSAGEIRRGLELALDALVAVERDESDAAGLDGCTTKLRTALADLDAGSLAAMGSLIEDVRKTVETL